MQQLLTNHPLLFHRSRWLMGVHLVLALVLAPEDAFARAGGGGGYGGGGGGGGFGGGGGGFGGGSVEGDLWTLAIVGALLLIIFLVKTFLEAKQSYVSRTIRRGHAQQASHLRDVMLARIKDDDPEFDLGALKKRVKSAFQQTQEAWSRQDMQPVRAFISDGILERFSLQLGMQQAEGLRNIMEDVRVQSVKVAAAVATDQFDTLHLRIKASATDYQIDVDSGREVNGTRRNEEFVEFWSFHRRHGAITRVHGGSIEGQCPQCGSPLNIVDKAQCAACSAWVNSAEHDWVLAEITQQSEWNLPGDETTTPGVAAIRQRDPHFSIQHLEDRTSVMFWRLRAAEFYQEIGYARPVVAHEADRLTARIAEKIERRESIQEPAVGLVDLIDIRTNGDRDMARVKIRWSGTKQRLNPSGKQQMLHLKAIYTEVYTLERRAGVASGTEQTFATASCGDCGAPLGVNRDESCQFCGTPLTDGRQDWVLSDVSSFTADLNRYSESLQSRYEKTHRPITLAVAGHTPHADRELDLAVIARVLTTDGKLTKREVRAFRRLADREGIPRDEADLMLVNARALDVPLPIPENGQQAKLQLEQVAYTTLIDGRLTRAEKKLLSRYASHFDLSAADVKLVVRDTQSRLYREAKQHQNGKA